MTLLVGRNLSFEEIDIASEFPDEFASVIKTCRLDDGEHDELRAITGFSVVDKRLVYATERSSKHVDIHSAIVLDENGTLFRFFAAHATNEWRAERLLRRFGFRRDAFFSLPETKNLNTDFLKLLFMDLKSIATYYYLTGVVLSAHDKRDKHWQCYLSSSLLKHEESGRLFLRRHENEFVKAAQTGLRWWRKKVDAGLTE